MLAKKRSPKYTRADFPPTHAVLDADFKLFAKHTHNKRRLKVISTNGTIYRTMREAKLVFSLRAQLAEAQVSVVDLKDDLESCQELCAQLVQSENTKRTTIEDLETQIAALLAR